MRSSFVKYLHNAIFYPFFDVFFCHNFIFIDVSSRVSDRLRHEKVHTPFFSLFKCNWFCHEKGYKIVALSVLIYCKFNSQYYIRIISDFLFLLDQFLFLYSGVYLLKRCNNCVPFVMECIICVLSLCWS